MRLKNRRGIYISNSRCNALLFEKGNEDLRDCFWFENSEEISSERFKEYTNELYLIEKKT